MTQRSLLQDWDLLQRRVIPALLEAGERVRVWTIGSRADAVAVVAAFDHATAGVDLRDVLVYCSPPAGPERVTFCFSDLAALPIAARQTWVERRDRRWRPVRRVAERVVMAEPTRPVDLVTWRTPTRPDDGPDSVPASVLASVRGGGLLLATERPLRPVSGLEPAGADPRLLRRTAKYPTPSRPLANAPGKDGETLAAWEERADLVEAHLDMARALAGRFANRGQAQEILQAVAYLALAGAARRFNPQQGAFKPYAAVSVLGELKRHFRDQTWAVRVPRQVQERHLAIRAAQDELAQKLGASPTIAQLADHVGLGEDDVLEVMDAGQAYRAESLDATPSGSKRTGDVPVHDRALEDTVERQRLRQVLPSLARRDQLILKRLFFEGWTQRQVADELQVSQMQISRLQARTLERLRRTIVDGPALPT